MYYFRSSSGRLFGASEAFFAWRITDVATDKGDEAVAARVSECIMIVAAVYFRLSTNLSLPQDQQQTDVTAVKDMAGFPDPILVFSL